MPGSEQLYSDRSSCCRQPSQILRTTVSSPWPVHKRMSSICRNHPKFTQQVDVPILFASRASITFQTGFSNKKSVYKSLIEAPFMGRNNEKKKNHRNWKSHLMTLNIWIWILVNAFQKEKEKKRKICSRILFFAF